MSLLFTLDRDLDTSYQDIELGHILLYLVVEREGKLKDSRGAKVAEILILNDANVIIRDIGSMIYIEMAVLNSCTVDYFKLL